MKPRTPEAWKMRPGSSAISGLIGIWNSNLLFDLIE